jgi:hypothetical protein
MRPGRSVRAAAITGAKPVPLRLAQIQAVARRGQDAGCGTSGASGLACFADGEKQLSMGTGTQQRRLFQRYEDVQDVKCRQT